MTPWLVLALVLALAGIATALAPARLWHRHSLEWTQRAIDQHGTGERRTFGVCRCGASKPLPGGHWSHFFCRRPR